MKIEAKAPEIDPRLLDQARRSVAAAMRRRTAIGMSYFYLALTPFFWAIGVALMNRADIEAEKCGGGVAILSLGPYLTCMTLRIVAGASLAGRMTILPGMVGISPMLNFPKAMAGWSSYEITLCDAEALAIQLLVVCIVGAIARVVALAWAWLHPAPTLALWDAEADFQLAPKGHS